MAAPNIYRLSGADAIPLIVRTANIDIATPLEFSNFAGNYSGVTVDIDLDAITGTSVTFSIVGFNDATDDWFIMLSSAAQGSAANVPLTISPYSPVVANVSTCRALPSRIGLITSGTWNPATFGGDLIFFGSR